jgi:hypothetical protein
MSDDALRSAALSGQWRYQTLSRDIEKRNLIVENWILDSRKIELSIETPRRRQSQLNRNAPTVPTSGKRDLSDRIARSNCVIGCFLLRSKNGSR